MFSLNLDGLLVTNAEPRKKYLYVNNEKTDKVEGYTYRLVDTVQGQILNVTIPVYKEFPAGMVVDAVNATGRAYVFKGQAEMSIKAEDLVLSTD